MNPNEMWLEKFGCATYTQLYPKLEKIALERMGMKQLPFPLAALKFPTPENAKDIFCLVYRCSRFYEGDYSELDAINLIQYLKENPPLVTYQNPNLTDIEHTVSVREANLMNHILISGLELPGSRHNLFGMGYFSTFFIDMYFGNITEFMAHVSTLTSSGELKRALKMREGYCQYSPIFAPILGLRMINLEENQPFTKSEIREIRLLYTGSNENKHLQILKRLLKLKVDPNAHDYNGFTALHYAVHFSSIEMIQVLLKHGANPNAENRFGIRPLTGLYTSQRLEDMMMIDLLIQYNGKLRDKEHANQLRYTVQKSGIKSLAIRVRGAMPRDKEECEHCARRAEKKCSACSLVYYCSRACQKVDWKFHKVICQTNN